MIHEPIPIPEVTDRIGIRARLQDLRQTLPARIGVRLPAPDPARTAARLRQRGIVATLGYYPDEAAEPREIAAACKAAAARMSDSDQLAISASALKFDKTLIDAVAATGRNLMFDATCESDAERTLDLARRTLFYRPGTGIALPARWQRSLADAAGFRDSSARIRVTDGEHFVALVEALAGRTAPVLVAARDLNLAARALDRLISTGTPCEFEQLDASPDSENIALAQTRAVGMRVHVPFGPGWWPHAIDKALSHPSLPAWIRAAG